MNKIFFYSADKVVDIKNRSLAKKLIADLFGKEKTDLDRINYIFCSDDYILNINQQYLNHNTLTDIITFPLSNPGEAIYGEIYLSVQRIKENAKTYGVAYQTELLRVLIHGALHLCGYIDKTKKDKLEMRAKEDFYLKAFNVTRETNN